MNYLLSATTLNKLVLAETAIGNDAYKITDLFSDLKKGIWTELSTKKPIEVYRRNLQKSYINILSNFLNPSTPGQTITTPGISITISSGPDKSDIQSVVRAHLVSLKNEANVAATAISDPMSKYHLQDVSKRIDKALNPKD